MLVVNINCSQAELYYFNQSPPGESAELFAPEIISLEGRLEGGVTFSPDGKEFCFVVIDVSIRKTYIYYTEQKNERWSEPQIAYFVGDSVGSGPRFSPDGELFSFNYKNDIWICERNKQGWSRPQILPSPINTDKREGGHSFTIDRTIYFTSNNRYGKKTRGDIYRASLNNNAYKSAEKIPILSTNEYDEDGVYISPDEKFAIFYSFNRPDGYGGYDLYISFKTENNSWTIPENMGAGINTKGIESQPFLSPDKKYLFFNRFDNNESDIYWIDAGIINELKNKSKTLEDN